MPPDTAALLPDAPRPPPLLARLARGRAAWTLPAMFIAAVLFFALMAPQFLSADNLVNVLRQSVYLLIVALGQLIVLIVGGLDLSVGALVSLTSVASASTMAMVYASRPESPWWAVAAGCGAGLAIGLATGLANGWASATLRIAPFMMTLGMSSVLAGLALWISGGVSIYGMPPVFGQVFGFGDIAGLPTPTLFALAAVAAVYGLLEWSRLGRHLYATGGNPRAAELSGVRTRRVIIAAFMLSSCLAVLSGLLLTARLDTGESNVGTTLPLESIAACVIAGVSLSGGRGRTLNVLLGTLLIALVQNGLNLMQVGTYAQTMVTGLILILAMALSGR